MRLKIHQKHTSHREFYLLVYNTMQSIESHWTFQRNKSPPQQSFLAACFMLVSWLAYSSTLKMKATCSPKTSLNFQWTTWPSFPEDRTIHNHCCENLKSYTSNNFIFWGKLLFVLLHFIFIFLIMHICKNFVPWQIVSYTYKFHLMIRSQFSETVNVWGYCTFSYNNTKLKEISKDQ
jgi:hypothetical protein